MNRGQPLLSVIIPVYGTEAYLDACMQSIVGQTYRNLQILVVNDASPGNADEIIGRYVQSDPRVELVRHEDNKGLFQSRLTGYTHARGDYIVTIDSDDTVNIDYFRILVQAVCSMEADIVIADFAIQHDERYTMRGYASGIHRNRVFTGGEVFDSLVQENFLLSSHRWFMWNKIYKKSVWDASYGFLSAVEDKINMLEDLLFGMVFASCAQKAAAIDDVGVLYRCNPESTSRKRSDTESVFRMLDDTARVFAIIEEYLKPRRLLDRAAPALDNCKKKYQALYIGYVDKLPLSSPQKKERAREIKKRLAGSGGLEYQSNDLFYRENTTYDRRMEHIRARILDGEIEYVSFDIFDTLIKRPFYEPKDLFWMMNAYYEEETGRKELFGFDKIRVECERSARKRVYAGRPDWQEITLGEIYDEIRIRQRLTGEQCERLMRKEIELELQYCTARRKVKQLYEMAAYVGKKIIILSDMYLDRGTIDAILLRNGYTAHTKLYLSSQVRLGKWTGGLFDYALRDLGVAPEKVLHIGDNWDVDIVTAKKTRLQTEFVPKGTDLLHNHIGPYKLSNYTSLFKNAGGNWARYQFAREHYALRCMLGLIAANIYDNPFPPYSENSNFNCDPFEAGYFALGPHNIALAKWLLDSAAEKRYNKIHFVARDGFLLHRVARVAAPAYPGAPELNYLAYTRKSSMIMSIGRPGDFYALSDIVNYEQLTPRDILDLFGETLRPMTPQTEREYQRRGLDLDAKIGSIVQFHEFVECLIELSYDEERFKRQKKKITDCFRAEITEHDCMFDIGYSGRGQAILRSALGIQCDAYYLMTTNARAYEKASRFGFGVYCFFAHVPTVSIKLLEVLMSESGPSCKGYSFDGQGRMIPVYEKDSVSKAGKLVLGAMHSGAVQFAEDFIAVFGGAFHSFHMDNQLCSSTYDFFLHMPKKDDVEMLSCLDFEGPLDGEDGISLTKFWRGTLRYNGISHALKPADAGAAAGPARGGEVESASAWKKAIYYYLFDRDAFKVRLLAKYARHTGLVKFARGMYRLFSGRGKGGKKARGEPGAEAAGVKPKPDLYYAVSNYNILCCILHRICFNFGKPAILAIPSYRRDKLDALKRSGFFDDVAVVDEGSAYEAEQKYASCPEETLAARISPISKELFKVCESALPFDPKMFEELYIVSDHQLFGAYLAGRKIPYHYFEDGTGTFTYPDLILMTQKKFSALRPYLIEKYQTMGRNRYVKKRYVKFSAQADGFQPDDSFIDFASDRLLAMISEQDMNKILSVYNGQKIEMREGQKHALLLTQPFVFWKQLSAADHMQLYALLADYFLRDYSVIVKPHPDDAVDYGSFLHGAVCLDRRVISELLPFVMARPVDLGATVSSTAMENTGRLVKEKLALTLDFSQSSKRIHSLYVLCRYLVTAGRAGVLKSDETAEAVIRNLLAFAFDCGRYGARIEVAGPSRSDADIVVTASRPDAGQLASVRGGGALIWVSAHREALKTADGLSLLQVEVLVKASGRAEGELMQTEYITIVQKPGQRPFEGFEYTLRCSGLTVTARAV